MKTDSGQVKRVMESHTERLGPFVLSWEEGVFPLGADALRLGRFATVKRGWRVCDLGTGSGVLLLLLAERERALDMCGVELDLWAAETARANLERNGLRGEIRWGDLRERPFADGSFDLVISNPPYFPVGSGRGGGPARSEETCSLEELCRAASRLTRNGGRFALCHRPERMTDVLCALRRERLEPKRLQLVAHTPERAPFLLLVEAVKGGRPGLQVEPQLREATASATRMPSTAAETMPPA